MSFSGVPTASRRSLRALDGLNFCLADVRDGVGPYLAIYLLASRTWPPGEIGIAMSPMGMATLLRRILEAGRCSGWPAARECRIMDIAPERITAGILAGGRGRRLGGIDKGWYEIDGIPLVEHTLARVASQCAQIMISANRTLARYRALGHAVHPDDSDDYEGPLAGVANILRAAKTPYVLIVPVDTPRLPQDLAERLAKGMGQATQIAVARCDDQVHALHALLRRDVLGDLEAALFAGTRAVREWEDGLDRVFVDWPSCAGFANINTAEDAEAIADSR